MLPNNTLVNCGKYIAETIGISMILCIPSLAAVPTWDHIVVVIEENHSFNQVIGSASAPYINSLAAGGANLNSMYGITHPSQPNYLQFFSGSNQGITSNNDTSPVAPFSTLNLGAELITAGKTFTGFSESLPSVGYTGFDSPVGTGLYTRKHNPWVSWQANDAPSSNHLSPTVNQPFTAFPSNYSTLPAVSIVVPNNDNNMHDGSVMTGDSWLAANLSGYANWAVANNSLLIVTFDEDNSASRNRIPTIFYGANVNAGAQVDSTFTLHNLLHTIEAASGTATNAGSSNDVRSIVGAFTSDPTTMIASFQQGNSNGYDKATDTWIESANPNTSHANDSQFVIDGSPNSQGLIRFDDIFGTLAGQVPAGATILSAKLSILTGSATNDESASTMALHQLLVPFDASSTWNSLSGGVSLGSEAVTNPEFSLLANTKSDYAIFDVTDSITAFANGSATNFGWLIDPSGTDGWRPNSSDAALANRPILQITYAIPEPTLVIWGTVALISWCCFRTIRHPSKPKIQE